MDSSVVKRVAIDCFSGAGGLALGLQRAGFDVRAAFDADALAVETYRRNLGGHAFVSRSEDLCGSDLLRAAGISEGECDLVVGGPPCQGFSRQRRGVDADSRNALVLDFFRLVAEVRPTFFLMENVSAIGGRRGKQVLGELSMRASAAGYVVRALVLDAAEYGVPQHRKRMFIVGERDTVEPTFRFPKPTHSEANFVTVRGAIADLPKPSRDAASGTIANHEPDNISELNRRRIAFVPQGGGRDYIPEELRLPCHKASSDEIGHRNVYGRLHWDKPAGTITTKCNSFTRGMFAHPEENRNISMREAARLQSFPDTFVFTGDKVAVAHQIGNAVPPVLSETIGRSLFVALGARQARSRATVSREPEIELRV